jgi:hypothetical protein
MMPPFFIVTYEQYYILLPPNELRIDAAEGEKVKRKAVKRRRICPVGLSRPPLIKGLGD